jgi:hypothetical protein
MRSILYAVVLIIVFEFFKSAFSGVEYRSEFRYLVYLCIIFVPLTQLGLRLKRKDRDTDQKRRAKEANENWEADSIKLTNNGRLLGDRNPYELAVHAKDRAHAVFLRPFLVDEITVRNPDLDSARSYLIPFYRFFVPGSVSLDDGLKSLVPSSTEFVSINSDMGHIGAAGLRASDGTWQELFERLVPEARLIFVIPGVRPGTQWEIKRLVELSLLDKSVFILFPVPSMITNTEIEAFELDRVREMMRACGIDFPTAAPAGGMIQTGDALLFDNRGTLIAHQPGALKQGLRRNEVGRRQLKKVIKHTYDPSARAFSG